MKSVRYWWIFSVTVVSFIAFVVNEEIPLPCEEFKDNQILYDGLYCTVSNVHLTDVDTLNCDVIPYYRQLVKVVKFLESRSPNIPYMLFHYFEGIREFDISFTELESIRRGDFMNAEDLMYLTASHNKLNELTSSLFVGAPNISVVDFSFNQIEKVSSSAFTSAIIMSRLHLSHNLIRTLDKDTFSSMTNLDELHLDFNLLDTIDVDLFAFNTILAKLSLNNNRIIRLECDAVVNLQYISKIDLSVNKLQEFNTSCITTSDLELIIHDNQLKNLTVRKVSSVDASHNQIKYVFIEDGISNLKSLKMANNQLSNITAIFEHLSSLETLDLSYNYVGKLNISTFAKLTNLEHLKLSHTNLSNLNFGTFFHQKELKSLDISYNNLNKINFDIFLPYLKNLESFVLDGKKKKVLCCQINEYFFSISKTSY